jgi:hypothetical protein
MTVPSVWLVVVSVKVTLPVGVPPVPETVAVNVTDVFSTGETTDDVTVVVVAVSACAAPTNNSNVAHASAAPPITRRSFRPARDAHNTLTLNARVNAPRPTCHAVFT